LNILYSASSGKPLGGAPNSSMVNRISH